MTLLSGIDVGSITVKLIVTNEENDVFFKYENHYPDVKTAAIGKGGIDQLNRIRLMLATAKKDIQMSVDM